MSSSPSASASDLFTFDDSFGRDLEGLYERWQGAPVPAPHVLVLNEPLAIEMGLDPDRLRSPEGVGALCGDTVPDGARPLAQAYAGHQFGGFSPRLGDGRALLVGELIGAHGRRRDLHLKGSGRTPFSRGGDGKATVGPMLREYIIGEAMHALGIPTTRALAVVATGEQVARDGALLSGAVLARVASSHLRVGTFQYAATQADPTLLRRLTDYSIARHSPAAADDANPPLAFLRSVVSAQSSLIAQWMLVGFIHGVMNTDNMTISGETIDYGPCAFMDRYDPATVFSSIDHGGRYAYANQPGVAQWNLARLAETLLPLIDDNVDRAVELATEVLAGFRGQFHEWWLAGMRAKLGIVDPHADDESMINELLVLMQKRHIDYTNFFRASAGGEARSLFAAPAELDDLLQRWSLRCQISPERSAAMNRVSPVYIPRNHLVEAALSAAIDGDPGPAHALIGVLAEPYDERRGLEHFAEPGPADDGYRTFCGT